jgi:hypothetical protein
MRSIAIAAICAAATVLPIANVARAEPGALPDRIKLEISRAEAQAIWQGLMKLPYETSAPLLTELQRQLEAQTEKPKDDPEKKPAK